MLNLCARAENLLVKIVQFPLPRFAWHLTKISFSFAHLFIIIIFNGQQPFITYNNNNFTFHLFNFVDEENNIGWIKYIFN